MVKKTIDKKIFDKIRKYRKIIEHDGILVEEMVLFGSHAKGKASEWSDIDVAVVSKNFGQDDVEEMQWLWKRTRFADARIEPYPVPLSDFKTSFSPIISEIRKTGIKIV